MTEYIFDKRKLKKLFTKYGLIFLGAFPLLLILNVGLLGVVSNTWRTVILVIVGVTFVLGCELVLHQLRQHKEKKQNQDVVTIKAGTLGKKRKTYVNKASVLTSETNKTNTKQIEKE